MGTLANLSFFPLSAAWLCPACNTVQNQTGNCVSCANSHGLMSLAGLLNRSEPTAAEMDRQESLQQTDPG